MPGLLPLVRQTNECSGDAMRGDTLLLPNPMDTMVAKHAKLTAEDDFSSSGRGIATTDHALALALGAEDCDDDRVRAMITLSMAAQYSSNGRSFASVPKGCSTVAKRPRLEGRIHLGDKRAGCTCSRASLRLTLHRDVLEVEEAEGDYRNGRGSQTTVGSDQGERQRCEPKD